MIDYQSSFQETLRAVGERARQLRLLRQLRQEELAARAGVGIATVRRFEKTGQTSLEIALRIATALNAERAFDELFQAPSYASLDEALARPEVVQRRRVSRRR